MILRYVLCWPVNFALVAAAFALSPFLALWSMRYGPVLPGKWRWFSTLNNTLDGWIEVFHQGVDPHYSGVRLWWQRTAWTWRNPCNGWQSELLGVADVDDAFTVKRNVPMAGNFYLKLWLGWNPGKRGGNYFPYMFQCGLKKG